MMSWLYNLSFRWKLTIPVSLLALLMLFNARLVINIVGSLGSSIDKLADEQRPEVDLLPQADRDLHQALVADRRMIFVDTQTEDYKSRKQAHNENIEQTRTHMGKFFQTTQPATMQERKKPFSNCSTSGRPPLWRLNANAARGDASADARRSN